MPFTIPEMLFDPPPTGRKDNELSIRSIHPLAAKHKDQDLMTLRLILLAHSHPEVASIGDDEIIALDLAGKEALVAQFERALGLDKPPRPI